MAIEPSDLVNPRLTILDRFAVDVDMVYRFSAVRDFLPVFRGLRGIVAPGETKVRGISPGYVAWGEQADQANPTNFIITREGRLRALAGANTADGAPLRLAAGEIMNTDILADGSIEWAGGSSRLLFTRGGIRDEIAMMADVLGTSTPEIYLQPDSPGNVQSGNGHIDGTFIAESGFTGDLTGNADTSSDGVTSASGTAPLTLTLASKILSASLAITPTNDGGAVALQAATPSTQQTGGAWLSGALRAGSFAIGSTTAIDSTRTATLLAASLTDVTNARTTALLRLRLGDTETQDVLQYSNLAGIAPPKILWITSAGSMFLPSLSAKTSLSVGDYTATPGDDPIVSIDEFGITMTAGGQLGNSFAMKVGVTGAPIFKINGSQLANVAHATDNPTAITQLNLVIDRLVALGAIAAP